MLTSLAALLPLLAAAVAAEPGPPMVVRQVIIERQVIMRVPVQPRSAPPTRWLERDGPKCLAAGELVGATLAGPQAIDFVLRNHTRYRAKLDSGCPTLDFYGGFYLQPAGQRLCAGRDSIRSRMGASCRIEQFRRLQPIKDRQLP